MGYSQRVCAGRGIADSCGHGKAWISASLAEIRSVRSGRSNLAPKGQDNACPAAKIRFATMA